MRYMMVHCLSGVLPLYIINEFPRSGGTWVGEMLGEALDVPLSRGVFPPLRSSIMHGHYMNRWGMKNVVIVWRDGRDVIISWYYTSYFKDGVSNFNHRLVDMMKEKLPFKDYTNIQENLPKFIEFNFMVKPPVKLSWSNFVRKWHGLDSATYVRYEDLTKNTIGELCRLCQEVSGKDLQLKKAAEIVEKFSFLKRAKRQAGQENPNSFFRKGIVGDWKNNFTKEACEVFNHFAGKELILLGYESDKNWALKH